MDPIIGIPLCLDAGGRIRAGREYLYIDIAYARAVAQAGGIPLHTPLVAEPESLIEHIDGLLLPGGDDFLPTSPSYPSDVAFEPADPRQIAFDRRLLAIAIEREVPVLGICYGAQLIALHHGGSLHHHLPIDCPAASEHRLPEPDGRHAIAIEPGSRLARLLEVEHTRVNSLHHQGIATPGSGLSICASADDGVVEAIESEAEPFCIGVQWHPEKLMAPTSDALFQGFVDAARQRGGRGRSNAPIHRDR